jgi:hypothetical protein
MLLTAFSRMLPRRSWNVFPVKPETFCTGIADSWPRRWTYPHRRPGWPSIGCEVRKLVLRLARENPSWGYQRIVGELRKLGVALSASSVRNILGNARDGAGAAARLTVVAELPARAWPVDPRLRFLHGRHPPAAPFVRARLPLPGSRRVEYLACTTKPDTAWMLQQARNLLMTLDDHDRQMKVSDPRPRCEVPARVRRPPSERRSQSHPHTRADAKRERGHGALDRQRPPRVPRPAANRQPPPARTRPSRLRQALQPTEATPRSRPATTRLTRTLTARTTLQPAGSSSQPPRPGWRPHPRIRTRRGMTIEFLHPTG